MKVLLITTALVLFYSSVAFSAVLPLRWDPSEGAVGYKLQTSTDLGVTWGTPIDVAGVLEFSLMVPDDTLLLIRNTSYNTFGETIRTDAGVWFNSSWSVPSSPTGIGAQ